MLKFIKSIPVTALVALIAAISIAPGTPASALTYNEPPDLSNDISSPTSLGTLNLGANTFTGGLTSDASDLSDAFSVVLPVGLSLTNIQYFATGTMSFVEAQGFRSTTTVPEFLFQASSTGGVNAGILSPPPGEHIFEAFVLCPLCQEGASYNLSWTATLTTVVSSDTSAVPLPAALPLFATGLGVMALLGRRRKKGAAKTTA